MIQSMQHPWLMSINVFLRPSLQHFPCPSGTDLLNFLTFAPPGPALVMTSYHHHSLLQAFRRN